MDVLRLFARSLVSETPSNPSPFRSLNLTFLLSLLSLSFSHQENRPIKLKKDHIKTRKRRCRGSEDLEQATATAHLTSSYSTMQHYPTTQGYVMMASAGIEPQRDQHSPLSDGSVTMVTSSAAPTTTQSSVY